MNEYKEIVTKAVISKETKKINIKFDALVERNITKVIGAYILNNEVCGKIDEGVVKINGVFDTNIWYSYDNNTKTDVITSKNNYEEILKVDKDILDGDLAEVKVKCITPPVCTNAIHKKNKISYVLDFELQMQLVGEVTIRIKEYNEENKVVDEIEVNTDYLKE
ncbi:MAG: outer spore coat protein CotE [Bacilli bacterium]